MKNKSLEKKYIINISKFLYVYYHIKSKDSYKLTHEQIKEMLDISTMPNKCVNENDVLTGRTILVKDIEGTVRGYRNPLLHEKETESILECPDISFNDDNITIKIDNIDSYSIHELEDLIKKCKKCHKDKTKNIIIKELHKRNNAHVESKEKKLEKVRKKEFKKGTIL